MGRHEFTYALMPHKGECCCVPSLPFSEPRFLQWPMEKQQRGTPTPISTTCSFPAQAPSRTLALSVQPTASIFHCWCCPPRARRHLLPGALSQCPPLRLCWRRSRRQGAEWGGVQAGSVLGPAHHPPPTSFRRQRLVPSATRWSSGCMRPMAAMWTAGCTHRCQFRRLSCEWGAGWEVGVLPSQGPHGPSCSPAATSWKGVTLLATCPLGMPA